MRSSYAGPPAEETGKARPPLPLGCTGTPSRYGTFTRELTLPTLVDADKVEARYENGMLKLTLPKAEAAKPRKITVRS